MAIRKVEYSVGNSMQKGGFEDLDCYKLSLQLMVNAHDIASKLPAHEKFDLADQMRRAAKSTPANIAEGYGRHHWLDALRFYYIARGSLNETINHLITARTLLYIEQNFFEELYQLARQCERALNGYIAYVNRRKDGQEIFGNRTLRENEEIYQVESERQA
jgi:four helix bundle protein